MVLFEGRKEIDHGHKARWILIRMHVPSREDEVAGAVFAVQGEFVFLVGGEGNCGLDGRRAQRSAANAGGGPSRQKFLAHPERSFAMQGNFKTLGFMKSRGIIRQG
jgi:hypothetical protein